MFFRDVPRLGATDGNYQARRSQNIVVLFYKPGHLLTGAQRWRVWLFFLCQTVPWNHTKLSLQEYN